MRKGVMENFVVLGGKKTKPIQSQSNPISSPHTHTPKQVAAGKDEMKIRLRGLEPLTFGSVDRRSIQLSYRRGSMLKRGLYCYGGRSQCEKGAFGVSVRVVLSKIFRRRGRSAP